MNHRKKMIAPIVATVLVVLYYIFYFAVLVMLLPGILKIICGIMPIGFAAVMIKMCIERIHEIRSGEEDDLSQY